MSWWEFRGFWGILQRSHDVDLPLIQEFVALGGDSLFGEVPHVADVFLRAVFAVVERVENRPLAKIFITSH